MELTQINLSKHTNYLLYFILAVIIYFVFFHRLDSFYIRTWDESIYAVNAYEMMEKNEYMVPLMNNVIDNDKPPMFFWHQIFFIKLFGFNEFSIRFPSALYGAFSVIMLFVMIEKKFNIFFAFSSALVLTCSKGFVDFHSSRTGEMDSMIAFAVLGLSIFFIKYVEEKKKIYLLFYFLFLVFGFYTKTIVILFILPIHFAYIIFYKREILSDTKLWLGLGFSVLLISLYIYLRSGYEDNYLEKHLLGLFSRYDKSLVNDHIQPFDFYINNLFNDRFVIFSILLFPALYLMFKETDKSIKFFISINSISAIFFLLIISFSASKLFWYDVPVYPLLAIPVGYFIWKISEIYSKKNELIIITISLFFIIPLYYSIKRSYNNHIADLNVRKCEVIPEYFHNNKNMPYQSISVVDVNFISPVLFYKYFFRQHKKEINIKNAESLAINEIVIAGNDSIKNYITTHYLVEQLETFRNATIYKIKQ